ncbi:MAG: 6-hydroxycyclohex-1-ene-1-carbonyl-CoA dehydrogenase [Planctomycetota bacterium]
MRILAYTPAAPGAPMEPVHRDEEPGPGEALVEVAGCGICHTDLGFYYEGVPTRHPFPLTLGHEVSGRVVEAGEGASDWVGKHVVVPAVIPCGTCDACRSGRGGICRKQIFPGNDVHGGFATHLVVPAHGLCEVPDLSDPAVNPTAVDLPTLSVLADAVSTAYQAILKSGLESGGLAVFIGAGGVGGFGIQVAAALGAVVVAVDVDAKRLDQMKDHGATLALNAAEQDFKSIKGAIRALAKERGIATWRRKVFETSGTAAGQTTAFGLLGPGGYLSVVGFTADKVTVRLSNLMAFDATAEGNWGCLPEHFPAVLDLVLEGRIALAPFVEHRPLSTINETFEDLRAHATRKRVVLVPE